MEDCDELIKIMSKPVFSYAISQYYIVSHTLPPSLSYALFPPSLSITLSLFYTISISLSLSFTLSLFLCLTLSLSLHVPTFFHFAQFETYFAPFFLPKNVKNLFESS